MSIVKITQDNIERYEIQASPRRTFSSSTVAASNVVPPGITGTLALFSDGSSTFKDVISGAGLRANILKDDHIESDRSATINAGANSSNFYGTALDYLTKINETTSSVRMSKVQSVIRFEPAVKINQDFQRKRIVKDVLFPFYRHTYPTAQWAYTNYHSLNFVTSSYLPSNSVLIYPAATGTNALPNLNCYAPTSAFTFDFYINPRYTVENVGDPFHAGTIFHMSSSYAISLITGSSISQTTAKPNGFRILLQLSQSAEIAPSSIAVSGNTASAPASSIDTGFLFVSDDNSLTHNKWHHVAIRWGGVDVQHGTGSFLIDGVEKGVFPITSASVMAPIPQIVGVNNADALFVGNFFEGNNQGDNSISSFFNAQASVEFGTLFISSSHTTDPTSYSFSHPLNAEVHDLKIFNKYRTVAQSKSTAQAGFSFDPYYVESGITGDQPHLSGTSSNDGLLFYVPPFFTKDTLSRYVNQTPFDYASGSTDDPFNVALSFGVGGHELNLQNFTREFVRGFYPRLLGLETPRIANTTPSAKSANSWLYDSGTYRKRNVTVLPCDNGLFRPNFKMLLSGGLSTAADGSVLDRFKNDFGNIDLSMITLNNMVSTSSLPGFDDPYDITTLGTGSLMASLLGPTPEDPGIAPGNILTILQRTKDPSSNEVVFFGISNMFYGDQLKPKSIVLKDLSVTGTNGRMSITLKDDGYGNLYRADASSKHATWASVGNVLYEEGLIVVKSPNLPLFGADAWEISFEGQRNIHVLEINVPAHKGLINSSSNPTYKDMIPSDYPSDTAKSFVYLTGMQFHDENMNVVGRVNFAQPIVKRDGDKYTIRTSIDF